MVWLVNHVVALLARLTAAKIRPAPTKASTARINGVNVLIMLLWSVVQLALLKDAASLLIISVPLPLVTLVTLSRVMLPHLVLHKHVLMITVVYQHVQQFLVQH
jgi:hypothetical protein